jgi:tetratricopeptide (TPR) repeat protein
MKRSGATAGFYRQALLIREAMYGKDSSELISTIDGLAQACFERREYEEAEPLYKRLLSLWETQIGKDHPMVAVVLDKLVVFYAEQKKLAQAKEALARSVAVRERFLAVGLSHQGGEARAENDLAQARFFYQRALGVLEPGADNQEIVRQINRLIKELDAVERSEEDRKVGGKPR